MANSDLLKTPPRRKTARKHTGKTASTPSSGLPQVASRRSPRKTKSPPAKKQRVVKSAGGEEGMRRSGEGTGRGMEGGVEAGEKESNRSEEMEEEGKEEEGREVVGAHVKHTQPEEESMEVSEEERQDKKEDEVQAEGTPKPAAKKISSTPDPEKKKALHPFFGNDHSVKFLIHQCVSHSSLHPLLSSSNPQENQTRKDFLTCTKKRGKRGKVGRKKRKLSRGWFRSIDLWVMGPARSRCATLLCVAVFHKCPISMDAQEYYTLLTVLPSSLTVLGQHPLLPPPLRTRRDLVELAVVPRAATTLQRKTSTLWRMHSGREERSKWNEDSMKKLVHTGTYS